MSAGTTERPVRVVIEGHARDLGHSDHLRVRRQDGGVVLVPKVCAGVTIESREPDPVWTDGDVVQHVETDQVWRRVAREASRHVWTTGLLGLRSDQHVTEGVAAGTYRVLRHQAELAGGA